MSASTATRNRSTETKTTEDTTKPTTQTATEKLEGHDLAKLFPPVQGEDFDELVSDIKANGLQEPITKYEDKILDGLSRYRACDKAGVEPRLVEYEGTSPLAFVLSKNLRRRHLTADQRAVIAVGVLPLFEAEAKQRQKEHGGSAPGKSKTLPNGSSGSDSEAVTQAAKATGAGINRVQRLKRIKDKSPKDFESIKAGKLTSAQAEQSLRVPHINPYTRVNNRPVARPSDNGSQPEVSSMAALSTPVERPMQHLNQATLLEVATNLVAFVDTQAANIVSSFPDASSDASRLELVRNRVWALARDEAVKHLQVQESKAA